MFYIGGVMIIKHVLENISYSFPCYNFQDKGVHGSPQHSFYTRTIFSLLQLSASVLTTIQSNTLNNSPVIYLHLKRYDNVKFFGINSLITSSRNLRYFRLKSSVKLILQGT